MVEPIDSFKEHAHTRIWLQLKYRHGWGQLATYFAGLERGQLWGTRCEACQALWVPPRRMCRCGASALAWERLTGKGTVHALTQAHSRPPGYEGAWRTWVMVRFEGGSALSLASLQPDSQVGVGQLVHVVACAQHPQRMPALYVKPVGQA